ncbi:hypothetical protein BBJ28_00011384 [Nothophytophthora sp. Chile5]|nr:hypothetical protein BBJ28_00011384 [Nothophytophthora sp. Chile5]
MESWQRYPGAQSTPQTAEEAPGRRRASSSAGARASAPLLAVDEEKRAANDLATDQYPNGMQQAPRQQQPHYPTTNFEELPPPMHQGSYTHGQQVDPYAPQGYTGPSFVVASLRLCIFHMLNALLGLVASAVLSAGICAAATLLPVCCIGLLIFRVLVFIVLALAQWDITLGNYVAPAHQCAYTQLPPYGLVVGDVSGYRLSPNLAFFSPLSLMAMLYFVAVKPVIGCLSFLAVMLVVAPVASFVTSLTSLTSHYHGYHPLEAFDVDVVSFSRYPGLSLVGAICVTLLGIALMQLVAKISLQATRFFCCEKFSVTSRFAGPSPSMPYQYQHQYQPIAQNGATSYGARCDVVEVAGRQGRWCLMYPNIETALSHGSRYGTPSFPSTNASERQAIAAAEGPVYTQRGQLFTDYYVPPSYGQAPLSNRYHQERNHPAQHGFIVTTLQLALFHLFNTFLGVFAFAAVVTSVHFAVALIPLCCLGLLVFRGVVVLVRWLAEQDVKLSNYFAAADEDEVFLDVPDEALGGFRGVRLAPGLSYFSPLSVLVALYFSSVKMLLSIASFIVLVLFVLLPMVLVAANNGMDMPIQVGEYDSDRINLRDYPVESFIVWGCLFILTIVLMHLVASLSRAATRFFCCERIPTSDYYIPTAQYPATGNATARAGRSVQAVVCQALKVLVFLVLNYTLAVTSFVVVLFGIALTLGSLALCCLGVVVFQGLLYLAPLLARLDVALHNFVEPVERKLYGHIPHHGESSSPLSRPSLAVLLYFATAKLGVGVLSALVVISTFSLPIHALTSPSFRDESFDQGWLNATVFVVFAVILLVSGIAAMPYVAKLSCVTTRLLCREVFTTIHTRDYVPASPPDEPLDVTLPTYGTSQRAQHA